MYLLCLPILLIVFFMICSIIFYVASHMLAIAKPYYYLGFTLVVTVVCFLVLYPACSPVYRSIYIYIYILNEYINKMINKFLYKWVLMNSPSLQTHNKAVTFREIQVITGYYMLHYILHYIHVIT